MTQNQPENDTPESENPASMMNSWVQSSQEFSLPDTAETAQRIKIIRDFQESCRQHLKDGVDYGKSPGTSRLTLFKAGADTIVGMLGLRDDYEIIDSTRDWTKPLFAYEVKCVLTHIQSGLVVGTGIGECNSMESKYRYRQGRRSCPDCDEETIIKSRPEYGGGWYCMPRQGGCGAKFAANDPSITEQETGRVDNEDIYSQVNTLVKMAKKRAHVDAALTVSHLSHILTQDLDELEADRADTQPASSPPAASSPKPASGPKPASNPPADNRQSSSRPLPREERRCAVHGKAWGKTSDGQLAHPLGNDEWCFRDNAPAEAPSPPATEAIEWNLGSNTQAKTPSSPAATEPVPPVGDIIEDESPQETDHSSLP